MKQWELSIFPYILSYRRVVGMLAAALSLFRTRATLQLEILALRHQLGVLQRSVKKPKLNRFDRMLWAWFCGIWAAWRSALCIVKPDTVIAWHRKGFGLFWTGKVGRRPPGRPPVPMEVRKLMRKMSRDNPLWGAVVRHYCLRSQPLDRIGDKQSEHMPAHSPRAMPSLAWASRDSWVLTAR